MAKRRTLQIDVKGPIEENPEIIKMILFIDGRDCIIYTSKANYEALMYDKVFIRDGQEMDSANCLNTTNLFVEQL